jgi:predicted DCC family thiol-disulfide oxidoreductase YuxK
MTERRPAPVLVYDGACRLCRRSVGWLRRALPRQPDVVAYQDADLAALGLSTAEAEHSVQWVEPSGRVAAGHVAVARLLLWAGGRWRVLGALMLVPPVSWLAAGAYRLVAHARRYLP